MKHPSTSLTHLSDEPKKFASSCKYTGRAQWKPEIFAHICQEEDYASQLLLLLSSGAVLVPLFFLKSGTLILVFFGITILGRNGKTQYLHHTKIPPPCLRSAFALPSLWLHSKGGHKARSKWEHCLPPPSPYLCRKKEKVVSGDK